MRWSVKNAKAQKNLSIQLLIVESKCLILNQILSIEKSKFQNVENLKVRTTNGIFLWFTGKTSFDKKIGNLKLSHEL